jgi:uncharacterized BrkB/YihY/UPF0761 family membrane protein
MRLLLTGAVVWRSLFVPAVVSAFFWIGLDIFAAVYFSSSITTDSRLYGQIGVVFDLLTWFIAIASVVILGPLTAQVFRDRRAGESSARTPERPVEVAG